MQYRSLGRTGEEVSILCFGAFALGSASQAEADSAVGLVRDHGINYCDVAPAYGEAELRLGPALGKHRSEVLLASKTQARTKPEAAAELRESLRRLETDYLDLYQFHMLDTPEDLDKVTGPGGAYEAFLEAKEEGLVRFLGITGHRPSVQLEAVKRMDLDTVMCPVSFIERHQNQAVTALLTYAAKHEIGVVAIKAISSGPWPDEDGTHQTWYRPFDAYDAIAKGLRFTLSQPVTCAASAGDLRVLNMVVEAAEAFEPMTSEEQEEFLASASGFKPLFTTA